MAYIPKPSGLSADAIQAGTQFGHWVVTDPEVIRREPKPGENLHKNPRYAFVRCKCTACGTEKPVRVTYLLNGRSTSCCLKGFRHPELKTGS
jgi:hypothetical protein